MNKLIAVVYLVFLSSMLSAQTAAGIYFHDFFTGEPIVGVELSRQGEFLGISDSTGFVSTAHLSFEPLGLSQVTAVKEGYASRQFGLLPPGAPISSSVFFLPIELRPFTYDLPEGVNITSARSPVSSLTTPAAMSILEQEALEENQARSMAEALIGVPGVWVQKTNHGGGSPFVRGLTGNQTLLMIDGIRMNNSTYRYGPNQYLNTIDPASLSRVEVMRGQGSVQYGTDALGGAVNLLTKQLSYSPDKILFSGRVMGKYLGYDMERSGRAEVNLSGKSIAFSGGYSHKDFGELVAGGDLGTEAPSAYSERDLDAKIQWLPAPKHQLTLLYQQVNQSGVGRYDQVAQRGYQEYQFDPQQRKLAYLRWESFVEQGFIDKIQSTVSWQHSDETRKKQKDNSDLRSIETDQIRTFGASVEVFAHQKFWSMTSGIEWYTDQVHSSALAVNTIDNSIQTLRGLYPDGATAMQAGLFSLHRYERRKWQVNAGLRFNTFQLEAFDETFGELSVSPTALVGNAAFIWKLKASSSLIFSVNSGFRAPNINDLSSFGSFDSGIEVPSLGLASERSLTTELGYKKSGDMISWEVFLYQTGLSNLITRAPSSWLGQDSLQGEQVYQKVNTQSALIRGAEGNISFQPAPGLRLNAMIIYTYGADAAANPLRRIPPLNGRLQARYARASWWAKAEWLMAGKQARLSDGDIDDHRIATSGTPGWTVLNLRCGYDWKQISVRAGLENLFDEAYRIHGSGVDGMGRNVWLGLEWRVGERKSR